MKKWTTTAYYSAGRHVVVFAETEEEARRELDDALGAQEPLTLDEVEFDQFSDLMDEEEAPPDELARHLVARAARWWLGNLVVEEREWDALLGMEMDAMGLAGAEHAAVVDALDEWVRQHGRPVAGELAALAKEGEA